MSARTAAKVATRERVVAAAARRLRRAGLRGLSVAATMADAGLTHGGFYAHFASQDALAAAGIAAGFAESRSRTLTRLEALPPAEALSAWIDHYLGASHRDRPERGCVLPALAGEVARGGAGVRAALAEGYAGLRLRLAAWLVATGAADAEAIAASLVNEGVGAIGLARVLGATPESDRLLAASRAALRARAGLAA